MPVAQRYCGGVRIRNPEYTARVEHMFAAAPFVGDVGIELVDCGPGWCRSRLLLAPRHMQQSGVVHAGVQATMADHTAGAAAGTLAAADQEVLSAQFELHLLRPARGERLACRADVLKPGRQLAVVEAVVHAHAGDAAKLVAKLTATMVYQDLSPARPG